MDRDDDRKLCIGVVIGFSCLFILTFGIAGIVMYKKAEGDMKTMIKTDCVVVSTSVTEQSCSYCNYIKIGNDTQCFRIYYVCYQGHWTDRYLLKGNVSLQRDYHQGGYDNQRTKDMAISWLANNHPMGGSRPCWADSDDVVFSEPSYGLGIGLMSIGFGLGGVLLIIAGGLCCSLISNNCGSDSGGDSGGDSGNSGNSGNSSGNNDNGSIYEEGCWSQLWNCRDFCSCCYEQKTPARMETADPSIRKRRRSSRRMEV